MMCVTCEVAPRQDTPADASRVTVCDAEEAILSAEEAEIGKALMAASLVDLVGSFIQVAWTFIESYWYSK